MRSLDYTNPPAPPYAFSTTFSEELIESIDDSTPYVDSIILSPSGITTFPSFETTAEFTHETALTTFQSFATTSTKKKASRWTEKELTALTSIIREDPKRRITKKILKESDELKGRTIDAIRCKISDLKLGNRTDRKKKNTAPMKITQKWSSAEQNVIETIWNKISDVKRINKETQIAIANELQILSGSTTLRSYGAIRRYMARQHSDNSHLPLK